LLDIGGPHGAGKTTFALHYLPLVAKRRNFINADLIAAGLSPLAPAQQQAAAGRLLLREVQGNVQRRTGFALETTLAGRGYLKLVESLRARLARRVDLTGAARQGHVAPTGGRAPSTRRARHSGGRHRAALCAQPAAPVE
jgi:hypothetical protein